MFQLSFREFSRRSEGFTGAFSYVESQVRYRRSGGVFGGISIFSKDLRCVTWVRGNFRRFSKTNFREFPRILWDFDIGAFLGASQELRCVTGGPRFSASFRGFTGMISEV